MPKSRRTTTQSTSAGDTPLTVIEPLTQSTMPLMNVPVPSVTISDGMRK